MDSKLRTPIIFALIAGGIWYVNKNYDFTIVPPIENYVKEAIRRDMPDDANGAMLTIAKPCKKVQGGITDGVFECSVEFFYRSGRETNTQKVRLIKRKGRWLVKK